MPKLAMTYLLAMTVLTIGELVLNARRSRWRATFNFVANVTLLMVFAGYWLEIDNTKPIHVAVAAIVALGREVYSSEAGIRAVWNDPDQSERARYGVLITGAFVMIPAYFTAGMAAIPLFKWLVD